jgi:hypothetical protein
VVAALRDDATPEPQMEELEPFAPLDPRLVTEFK